MKPDVLVIGGGIIGVAAAYYLAREGTRVTLVERDTIAAGSSYGNAGLVSPSDSPPLPSPSALKKGVRWLFDPTSPLYIKPRPDPELLKWLWRFRGACNEAAFRRGMGPLYKLSAKSVALYRALVEEESIEAPFEQRGLLIVYRTPEGMEEGQQWAEAVRALGVKSEIWSAEQVRQRVPCARPEVIGGIYYREDAHMEPAGFVRQLAERARARGAIIQEHTEVLELETSRNAITRVVTTRGTFTPDQVVLAAGAWTPVLARKVGLRLPIQGAKGYSITVQRPDGYPEIPLILDEAKVAVTPMGSWLRFAGTLELAGLDLSVNPVRVAAIQQAVSQYLEISPEEEPLVELWRGLRPCTPDGLPIIGRPSRISNLVVAAGHCMLGISQGPATGKLVADLILGREPEIDPTPFRVDRYLL